VNNPFTSALNSLGQNFIGLGTGNNPSFAPQVINLFGFNLPGVPLISPRDYFLVQMESWFTAIPMSTQWVIVIDNYPYALRTNIIQGLERTDGGKRGFDISAAATILNSYPLQKVIGCLFANSISIPAEQFNVDSVAVPNNRGFLPGIIASNRQTEPPSMTIEFRDTNTSFVDNVIRPWTILASHYGMTARPGDIKGKKDKKNIKCNMTLLQYGRTLNSISMIPRKVFHFYNCVPYNIGEESLNYTDETVQNLTTRWTYSNYTVENNLYLPVQDIVNRISNGSIPRVTSFQNGIGSINPLGFV
jgi:hypothetical protein